MRKSFNSIYKKNGKTKNFEICPELSADLTIQTNSKVYLLVSPPMSTIIITLFVFL